MDGRQTQFGRADGIRDLSSQRCFCGFSGALGPAGDDGLACTGRVLNFSAGKGRT
jgi:hypothetical protein